MIFGTGTTNTSCEHYREAAEWHLRLRGGLSVGELLELAQWRSIPANLKAFELVRDVSRARRYLRPPRPPSAKAIRTDTYLGEIPVSEWLARKAAVRDQNAHSQCSRLKGNSIGVLALRLAAAVVGALALPVQQDSTEVRGSLQRFATSGAQYRVIDLQDRSKIVMGARTAMTVQYSESRRTVVLVRGEAFFTVAHNTARPFEVIASSGTITAVGTQFNVRSMAGLVTVTVTEGAVDVLSRQASPDPFGVRAPNLNAAARIVKGQQATLSSAAGAPLVESGDPGAIDWLYGRLQYRRIPLRYVVADVARYSPRPIRIIDQHVANCEFTGTLDRERTGDWVQSLERIFPVRVRWTDAEILILSRSESPVECAPEGAPERR